MSSWAFSTGASSSRAHLVDPRGGILTHLGDGPCWHRLRAGEPSPRLDLVAIDVTSVPQPDRIRGRVRMRGQIDIVSAPAHPRVLQVLGVLAGDELARFVPDTIVLESTDLGGVRRVYVPLSEYAAATTDPLAGWEAVWIRHLDASHGPVLRALAHQRIPLEPADSVRALRADSEGLEVRVYRAGSESVLRFDFDRPARCGGQAVAAFNQIVNRCLPDDGRPGIPSSGGPRDTAD